MLIKFNSSSDLNETLEHLFSEGPGPNQEVTLLVRHPSQILEIFRAVSNAFNAACDEMMEGCDQEDEDGDFEMQRDIDIVDNTGDCQ